MIEQAQAIMDELNRRAALDPQFRQIMKKIEKGKATFEDTALLSQRMGNLLGELFGAEVLDIPEDAREAICTALLKDRYKFTNETLADVQEALDEPQGIHLAPQKAPFPAERVQQIAHSLLDPNVKPETIQRRANQPVATVAKSFHDDYIKTNAKLRNDLGFKCYLDRVAATGCCAWCTRIAGRYVYGEHPDDIFRRHDNCSCTVTFENGRQRQDVWSKRSWDVQDPKEIERLASRPAVMSRQQAEQLQENALGRLTLAGERDILEVSRYGFNPLSASSVVPILRNESQQWISALTKEEIRAIQKYTKNSGDPKDDKFYARLNSMLRGEISENDNLRYYAELVSSALQKYDLQHDIICYRKIDFDAYKDFGVGDIFQEKQFTSTSVSSSGSMKKQFTIIIKCPIGVTGAYIEQLSKYPNQREFLINKDSWFRVLEKGENSIVLEVLVK